MKDCCNNKTTKPGPGNVCSNEQTKSNYIGTHTKDMKTQNNKTQTKEKELCPICKNGMSCKSIVFHSKHWNTEGGN